MLVFRTPSPSAPDMLGEAEGMTAGRGMVDGLGDTDRLTEAATCELKDDLRLCDVGGGFMGIASDCGVPGAEGSGDPTAADVASCTNEARLLVGPRSGGAGLLDDIRRPGKSILVTLLCWESVNCPSLFLSV